MYCFEPELPLKTISLSTRGIVLKLYFKMKDGFVGGGGKLSDRSVE